MATERLHPMSRVTHRENDTDSVRASRQEGDGRAFDVLLEAKGYWDNMEHFRADRWRNKDYNFGNQWGDTVTVDCKTMTEEEYIKTQGSVPLKNNLIRRLVRNVLGVYRSQSKEPTCTARDRDEQKLGETMSTILQCNMQLNRMNELYTRSFEEFLISGLVVHRKWFGWRNDKLDCWTDYVNPNNFFIDTNMRDFRGWNCTCVGEIHDISFNSLCNSFAESPEDYDRLARIYRQAYDIRGLRFSYDDFGYSYPQNIDFMLPKDEGLCRVIEVWRKESKPPIPLPRLQQRRCV